MHMFLSDQARLSVVGHAAHGPTTWACEAVRYFAFEHWLSHASLPVWFILSVRTVWCCSHLARPCKVFHSRGKDVVCIKIKQMQQKIYFIVWNIYECIMQPPEWSVGYAAGTNKKCTIKNLITYKRVLTDHCSKNLELRSHPLITTNTNRAESPRLIHRGVHKLVKAYDGL